MKTSFFVPFLFTEAYFNSVSPSDGGTNKSESPCSEVTLLSIFRFPLQKQQFIKQTTVPSPENIQIPKTWVLFRLVK